MPLFENVSITLKPRRNVQMESDSPEQPQPVTYSTLYKATKRCPEIVGMLNTLATDILGNGWTLTGDDKKAKQMDQWLLKIKFRKKIRNWIMHAFITGDGYLEYQEIPEDKLKSLVKSIYKGVCSSVRLEKGFRNKISSDYIIEKKITELVKKIRGSIINPFNLTNIKSSLIEIKVDVHGNPTAYIEKMDDVPFTNSNAQLESNRTVKFKPDEIIRWSPFDLGDVYGFSPMQAIMSDTATLLFTKEYAGKFFENGAEPDRVWILPDAKGLKDRNYEVLKTEIQNARKVKNYHKSMVFTGKVDQIKLNDFNKDMEFPNLLNQMTMRMLMGFNIPPTKTPFGAGKKGDSREMNENYWKLINYYQSEIEDVLNEAIFLKQGLDFKLSKPYKIDELREAQILGILMDRNAISLEEARKRIGYFGKVPPELQAKYDEYLTQRRDYPQRDLGDTQDGRGLGNDVGAKIA